jgi:type VI secretion system protein VasG
LKLRGVSNRVVENHKATFSHDEGLIDAIAGRCKEVESGARNVDHILSGTLLPDLAREVLGRMAEGKPITKIHVGVDNQGGFTYNVD